MTPPLKRPMWENLSRCFRVMSWSPFRPWTDRPWHDGLIGQRAEVGVDVRDQFVDENLLECSGGSREWVRAPPRAPRPVPNWSCSRDRSACGWCRIRPGARRASSGAASAAASTRSRTFVGQAVGHHDDEGPGLTFGDQVVHDQIGAALIPPGIFIFTPAVLQIQHRVALRWCPCRNPAAYKRRRGAR